MIWSALSDERTGLSFTIATGPRQRRAALVKVKDKVTLRLAVYRQSLHLGTKPLEVHDQRFLLQLNSFGRSPYVTSSLMREQLSCTECTVYNISARKIAFICSCLIIAVEACLLVALLLGNGCCVSVSFAVVA
jgi:hypothetical protein